MAERLPNIFFYLYCLHKRTYYLAKQFIIVELLEKVMFVLDANKIASRVLLIWEVVSYASLKYTLPLLCESSTNGSYIKDVSAGRILKFILIRRNIFRKRIFK